MSTVFDVLRSKRILDKTKHTFVSELSPRFVQRVPRDRGVEEIQFGGCEPIENPTWTVQTTGVTAAIVTCQAARRAAGRATRVTGAVRRIACSCVVLIYTIACRRSIQMDKRHKKADNARNDK